MDPLLLISTSQSLSSLSADPRHQLLCFLSEIFLTPPRPTAFHKLTFQKSKLGVGLRGPVHSISYSPPFIYPLLLLPRIPSNLEALKDLRDLIFESQKWMCVSRQPEKQPEAEFHPHPYIKLKGKLCV